MRILIGIVVVSIALVGVACGSVTEDHTIKEDKAKNQEIASKIEKYGENIFNNVVTELKKYI